MCSYRYLLRTGPLPITFNISTDLDLSYARWEGHISLDDFREMYAAYMDDRNHRPGRRELCDLSGLQDMEIDYDQVWSSVIMVNPRNQMMPVKTQCVVYAPNDTAFGLARMYQSLSAIRDGAVVTVCREEVEVMSELGLSYKAIDTLLENGRFLPNAPETSGAQRA